jgi:hypothetical protein
MKSSENCSEIGTLEFDVVINPWQSSNNLPQAPFFIHLVCHKSSAPKADHLMPIESAGLFADFKEWIYFSKNF